MQNLNTGMIGQMPVVVPPRHEQDMIVAYLDEKCNYINSLISKVHEGIDCIKEFRTALISAAVTGKIDVREEVA